MKAKSSPVSKRVPSGKITGSPRGDGPEALILSLLLFRIELDVRQPQIVSGFPVMIGELNSHVGFCAQIYTPVQRVTPGAEFHRVTS